MLLCSRKECNISISSEDNVIENTDTINVLCVHIMKGLKSNGHLSYLCNKAVSQLNVLRRIKSHLDSESESATYSNFILSNSNDYPSVCMYTSKWALSNCTRIQKCVMIWMGMNWTALKLLTWSQTMWSRWQRHFRYRVSLKHNRDLFWALFFFCFMLMTLANTFGTKIAAQRSTLLAGASRKWNRICNVLLIHWPLGDLGDLKEI